MSVLVVMERLKVEAVKEANALNPTRKGVYVAINAGVSSEELREKLIACLIEGDDISAYAFASKLASVHGNNYIYWFLFHVSITHANPLLLNISNRASYLCAEEQHRRPVKSHEVCLMYVLNILCKTVKTNDAIETYKFASESFDQNIKHARDSYWNKSLRVLQKLAEDKRLPIPQRIIALQYLYGVEQEDILSGDTKHYKAYVGNPEQWFDVSLVLAQKDVQLQILIQLAYTCYKRSSMIGLSLALKKTVDKKN